MDMGKPLKGLATFIGKGVRGAVEGLLLTL